MTTDSGQGDEHGQARRTKKLVLKKKFLLRRFSKIVLEEKEEEEDIRSEKKEGWIARSTQRITESDRWRRFASCHRDNGGFGSRGIEGVLGRPLTASLNGAGDDDAVVNADEEEGISITPVITCRRLLLLPANGLRNFGLVLRSLNFQVRYDSATVSISVTDVNDNPPVFLDSPYLVFVMEELTNLPSLVTTISAVDADQDSQLRYQLKEGDRSTFHVNDSTGAISLLKKLDREQTPEYHLVLAAMDSGECLQSEGIPVQSILYSSIAITFLITFPRMRSTIEVEGFRGQRICPYVIKGSIGPFGIKGSVLLGSKDRAFWAVDMERDLDATSQCTLHSLVKIVRNIYLFAVAIPEYNYVSRMEFAISQHHSGLAAMRFSFDTSTLAVDVNIAEDRSSGTSLGKCIPNIPDQRMHYPFIPIGHQT
ncbi:unnamed protein product [Cyprideis torosa]|uniref:Uncharacterized protein n=1 Tax=Cyprideis torosa TaxID=163714 RepID=A0A7R8W067_9CRUS|nr:unnamed protein product [Cyprideis torosa]CAG0879405.1 unnamed protein product [Cyprideis torosa]